jgi:hypothetical protein
MLHQSIEGRVEGPWREVNSGEGFDVLGEGVAVLRTVSKAREYECRRAGVTTQRGEFVCHVPKLLRHTVHSQGE